MALTMMAIGYPTGSAEFYSALRYSLPNIVAMVLFVIGGFLPETPRIIFWVAGLLSVIYGTIRASSVKRGVGTGWDPDGGDGEARA